MTGFRFACPRAYAARRSRRIGAAQTVSADDPAVRARTEDSLRGG